MAANQVPSLPAQVTRAEQRVVQRRRMVTLRATRLRHAVSEKLRDPKTLIWAAGAGFVAGELMQHRKSSAGEIDPPDSPIPSLLTRALHWSTIARALIDGFASDHEDTSH